METFGGFHSESFMSHTHHSLARPAMPKLAANTAARHSLGLAEFEKTRLMPRNLTIILGMALLLSIASCTGTRPFTDADGHIIPGSIATMEQVLIGGISQSIWFRGMDVRKPAVILLHGGPGASESALFRHYDAALEQHFLMVYWEQRGAGRSYHSGITRDSMTIAQFERDLNEVVDLVRQRFGKDRIILLAHSWGTEIGTIYAYQHPEKIAAYIGIAQVANVAEGERVSYEWALNQATTRNNRNAIAALRAISPGPKSVDDELAKGEWVEAFGGVFHQSFSTGKLILAALSTDEANLVDLVKFGQGNRFSLESLRPEYSKLDLTRYHTFQVPIVFLLGRYDWHVPAVLAEQYFNTIHAPCKRLIWFEHSAHNPPFEEPERFIQILVDQVSQLITRQSKGCMVS
jgi:pimeloyl-ACP methyl ester carboxylesterase